MILGELQEVEMTSEEYLFIKLFRENKIMAQEKKLSNSKMIEELDELEQTILSLYRKDQIVFIPEEHIIPIENLNGVN